MVKANGFLRQKVIGFESAARFVSILAPYQNKTMNS
jgi:hypothetical protein